MSRLQLLNLVILTFLINFGHAALTCSNPPSQTQTFFDLVELQSLFTKYPDDIQSPVKCSTENNSSNCASQICCGNEKGCCFNDTVNKRQICGCRAESDKTCTRGPPIVFVRTYRCEDPSSVESYICIQKYKEGDSTQGSVVTSIKPVSDSRQRVDLEFIQVSADSFVPLTGVFGSVEPFAGITTNDQLVTLYRLKPDDIDELPVDDILGRMKKEKLYALAQKVMERHMKGLTYGRD